MFGKLLAAPFRLVNAPIRALEKLIDEEDRKEDRITSLPLEKFAEAVEEAVDGEKKGQ